MKGLEKREKAWYTITHSTKILAASFMAGSEKTETSFFAEIVIYERG
jgi:hypothetical protein